MPEETDEVIDGSRVRAGDVLVGLPSSGPHSNGYSLIRRIIERAGVDMAHAPLGEGRLADALLAPTRIYVQAIRELLRCHQVNAMAHITGGGLIENLPRVLPAGSTASIDTDAWTLPPAFAWLQASGNLDATEMLRTFNCGVGMILVLPPGEVDAALGVLERCGERPFVMGEITAGEGPAVEFRGALFPGN